MTRVFPYLIRKFSDIEFCPDRLYAIETKAITKLFVDPLLLFILYGNAITLALGNITNFAFKCNSAAGTLFIFMPAHDVANFLIINFML